MGRQFLVRAERVADLSLGLGTAATITNITGAAAVFQWVPPSPGHNLLQVPLLSCWRLARCRNTGTVLQVEVVSEDSVCAVVSVQPPACPLHLQWAGLTAQVARPHPYCIHWAVQCTVQD